MYPNIANFNVKDWYFVTPWSLLLQGIALGLAAAATPGAFQAYLLTQSLMYGFRKGSLIAFAPLISDPPVVIIVLFVLNQLPGAFLKMLSLAGGIFVFYLAYSTLKAWRISRMVSGDEIKSTRGNILRGVLLNVLSPGLYLYWTLVNGPLLITALENSWLYGLSFLIGFYGTFVGGMLLIAAFFAQARRLGNKVVRVMLLVSTITLIAFGIFLIVRSLST